MITKNKISQNYDAVYKENELVQKWPVATQKKVLIFAVVGVVVAVVVFSGFLVVRNFWPSVLGASEESAVENSGEIADEDEQAEIIDETVEVEFDETEVGKALAQLVAEYSVTHPGHELLTSACFCEIGISCGDETLGRTKHSAELTCEVVDPVYGSALDMMAYSSHLEWQWLEKNSQRFGFTAESETPWHLQYTGVEEMSAEETENQTSESTQTQEGQESQNSQESQEAQETQEVGDEAPEI